MDSDLIYNQMNEIADLLEHLAGNIAANTALNAKAYTAQLKIKSMAHALKECADDRKLGG